MCDSHGRGVRLEGELAVAADGRFLALRTDWLCDQGAYLTAAGPLTNTVNGRLIACGGYAMQAMGQQLAAQGDLPVDDFARMPSGRIVPEDAQRFLVAERERVDERPEDWASWYRFGLAQDAARDRRRARAAMREAQRLWRTMQS